MTLHLLTQWSGKGQGFLPLDGSGNQRHADLMQGKQIVEGEKSFLQSLERFGLSPRECTGKPISLIFGVFLDTTTLTKPTMILQLGGCFDFSCRTSFFSSPPAPMFKKETIFAPEKGRKTKEKKRNNLDNYYPNIYISIYIYDTNRQMY